MPIFTNDPNKKELAEQCEDIIYFDGSWEEFQLEIFKARRIDFADPEAVLHSLFELLPNNSSHFLFFIDSGYIWLASPGTCDVVFDASDDDLCNPDNYPKYKKEIIDLGKFAIADEQREMEAGWKSSELPKFK